MSRPMINATLFNVSSEDDQYAELRDQMITDLVADELDQPKNVLRALLEDYSFHMFYSMEDDVLQDTYDNLMEGKEEDDVDLPPDSTVRNLGEYAEELRAEGKDVETMIITPGDLDETV